MRIPLVRFWRVHNHHNRLIRRLITQKKVRIVKLWVHLYSRLIAVCKIVLRNFKLQGIYHGGMWLGIFGDPAEQTELTASYFFCGTEQKSTEVH